MGWRQCNQENHPDAVIRQTQKMTAEQKEAHEKLAATKLANCRFGKAYIKEFQKKYGNLDPTATGEDAQRFLEKSAGSWAAAFGSNEHGNGAITEDEMKKWMTEIQHLSYLGRGLNQL